jgi:hypothetical protein
MTARKHDASTRFWELLQQLRSIIPKSDDPEFKDLFENAPWLSFSCSAIPGTPLDDAIILAFAKTDLNIRDPLEWKLLLGLFCIAHFGVYKKRAAPKQWTAARLHQLDFDAAEIKSRHPDFGDEAIANILKKTKIDVYGKYTISSIRERVAQARKSKEAFEKLLADHLIATRRLHTFFGKNWTSEIEAKVKKSFIETDRKISAAL